MILRGRVLLPISQPPIANGAIVISGSRIKTVTRWRDLAQPLRDKAIDLGEVLLMPGLINAHCHLDYTNMAGEFPPPKVFIEWLKVITATKAGWGFSDYAQSWLNGATMLLNSGTTTVADIEAVPELLPEVWASTPLRVISLLELIGITARRPSKAILQMALAKIDSLNHKRCFAGLSPHAPYSTVPELVTLSARTASQRNWLLCTHVAESAVEFAMFKHGRGEMFDWLQRSGRDMSDCGLGSPVQHLERCGALSRNLLAAHVNYLGRGDASRLARRQVNVVHCPRSHSYFSHGAFPLRHLRRKRINICLGTDSLASVYKTRRQAVELNMFEEMRELSNCERTLSAHTIVQMATVNGARALALGGRAGELKPGAWADLIALPFAGKVSKVYEAVLQHQGHVAGSMINGRWAILPT